MNKQYLKLHSVHLKNISCLQMKTRFLWMNVNPLKWILRSAWTEFHFAFFLRVLQLFSEVAFS